MAEPFSEIEKPLTAKASWEGRLREYPELKAKMERWNYNSPETGQVFVSQQKFLIHCSGDIGGPKHLGFPTNL